MSVGVWMIAIPEEVILNLIGASVSGSGMRVECTGFRKDPFFGFRADSLSLRKGERELIAAGNLSGRINVFSLVKLRLPLTFSGRIGDGTISGTAELLRKDHELSLTVKDVNTDAVPFVGLFGIKGNAVLTGSMLLRNGHGGIRFDLKDLKDMNGSFGTVSIPLGDFRSGQGALEVSPDRVRITSFTLEGPDIYARVKGDAANGRLNLTLEVMPEKAFIDRNLMLGLLERYQVSPGHYVIPLTNQLSL